MTDLKGMEAEMADNAVRTEEWDDVVEAIQLYSAGLISRRTVIERVGWVKDVDEELRRIQEDERCPTLTRR